MLHPQRPETGARGGEHAGGKPAEEGSGPDRQDREPPGKRVLRGAAETEGERTRLRASFSRNHELKRVESAPQRLTRDIAW